VIAIRSIFLGHDGLRAGWRFAAFFLFWRLGDYVVPFVLDPVYTFSDSGFTPADILVYKLADAAYLFAISVLLVRLEKHRTSWFGLGFARGSAWRFAEGCVWGFAPVTLVMAAAWAAGFVHVDGLALHGAAFWNFLALWLAGMLMVGLDEELQFRGYAMASLTRGIGFWPTAVLLSLAFGADHMSKPDENVPDILNIVLLGLFVAYSVRRTGDLWFAIGFHAAFDFFALAFYGSPNTGTGGLPLDHHLLDTHIAGPAWLTGGPQGLEASWLMTALTLAMFLLLHRRYPRNAYPTD